MSLLSTHWHRVAATRPSLAPQAELRALQVRGERWMLLTDPVSGRSCRLNAAAWALAGRLDGRRPMQALWEALQAARDDAPTQDEALEILTRLREGGLLRFDREPDLGSWRRHRQRAEAPRWASVLAWRLTLGDPSRLLDTLAPLGRVLGHPAVLGAWAAGLIAALLAAFVHADTLWAQAATLARTPGTWWTAALAYPLMKLVHETAHGLAVHRAGGRVRSAGVTLMLGLPVPWVDASAAERFGRRRDRLAVDAAGIVAELTLAAVAVVMALRLDAGPGRDAALVVAALGSVSTLVFNANPLQRLDGYHLLTDLLDLPNLAARSRDAWRERLRQALGGPADPAPMPVAAGEGPWLVAYAPLAAAWRLALVGGLALAALGVSPLLGLLALVLVGGAWVAWPAWQWAAPLVRDAALGRRGRRRLAHAAALLAGGATVLLALPWPHTTVVQGVLSPPEQAPLRAEADGEVAELHARDGDTVHAGDLILVLHDPARQAEVARAAARVAALESELIAARATTAGGPAARDAADTQAALDRARQDEARALERAAGLELRAGTAGRLVLPGADDLPGRWIRRGALLGHVLDGRGPVVQLAVPEADAVRWRALGPRPAVTLRRRDRPDTVLSATLEGLDAGAVHRLPQAALSRRHGGDVPTDPSDDEALQTLAPVVVMQARLPDRAGDADGAERLGQRVWVRVDEGTTAPARRLLDAWRSAWPMRAGSAP